VPRVDRFIAVSEAYARFMTGYLQIPEDRIAVVPIGINLAGYEHAADGARGAGSSGTVPFRIGYFARLAPEKGLHVLAEAFQLFSRRTGGAPVRLEAAGYLAPPHRPYLEDVQRSLERAGLLEQFHYHGSVDRQGKLAFLRRLDVLSVPATYDEPKGFFLLEAMASGVPVVQPRRGAFVEIVEKTGGGILTEPDDAASLAEGLVALWQDRERRRELARRAIQGVRTHYTVQRSADRLLEVYNGVIPYSSSALTANAGSR
jgi:glycosyltransferase involved in cell wall biosynthesis